MKTSTSIVFISLASLVAAMALGYSLRADARIRELEKRVQTSEAAWQSRAQSADATDARLRELAARLKRDEEAAARPQFVNFSPGANPGDLAGRVQKIEQQIEPHLQPIPPYVPGK